jgi:hypothetical protein
MKPFLVSGSAVAALGLAAGLYVFGAVSYHRQLWPVPQLRAMKQDVTPFIPGNEAVNDTLDRLVGYRGKREIACPPQTARTMVLLIAGQSNAANSGGQRYEGEAGVINYFAGKCYQAQSPLLGATGISGDSWTLLGNKLVENHLADQVILIASGMSGTSILKWQAGAPLNAMLRDVIENATKAYKITQVLWHQCEWDVGGMTRGEYAEKFMSLAKMIRASGVNAPIYVSIATRCDVTDFKWTPNNEISAAQRSLPNARENILQGVNTDVLLGPLDRMDDCHFAQSGQEKMAAEWVRILSPVHASAN